MFSYGFPLVLQYSLVGCKLCLHRNFCAMVLLCLPNMNRPIATHWHRVVWPHQWGLEFGFEIVDLRKLDPLSKDIVLILIIVSYIGGHISQEFPDQRFCPTSDQKSNRDRNPLTNNPFQNHITIIFPITCFNGCSMAEVVPGCSCNRLIHVCCICSKKSKTHVSRFFGTMSTYWKSCSSSSNNFGFEANPTTKTTLKTTFFETTLKQL